MYTGRCHCGDVQFTINVKPTQLVDCNCSLCRRFGALWAHVPVDSVEIVKADDATFSYAQGDKTFAVQTCKSCGCTTHYETLEKQGTVMAVNFRMSEPDVISEFRIRKFDGADTWKFID